jgi:hypothetical protein
VAPGWDQANELYSFLEVQEGQQIDESPQGQVVLYEALCASLLKSQREYEEKQQHIRAVTHTPQVPLKAPLKCLDSAFEVPLKAPLKCLESGLKVPSKCRAGGSA